MRASFLVGSTTVGVLTAILSVVGIGGVGCVVSVADNRDTGPADTGYDTGYDTDTGPDTDAGTTGVIIQASSLLAGGTDPSFVHAFGGGSSKDDILNRGRIAYAAGYAGGVYSSNIGVDTAGRYVDGKLYGLPNDVSATITVTGYLRGLNGQYGAKPSEAVAWAATTCYATPSAAGDVLATCTPLELLGSEIDGIVFTSDVLPTGYCAGKGASDFQLFRAQAPYLGSAVASFTTDDCYGVVFVPAAAFASAESGTYDSTWLLTTKRSIAGTECARSSACLVKRTASTIIVGSECQIDPGCFY